MRFTHLLKPLLPAVFAASALTAPLVLSSPARALPEAEVITKIDTILVLMSVDGQGKPRAVKATVDGKQMNAYLAAISVAAAEEIAVGKRFSLSKEDASTLRFTPVSLAKFNQLLEPLLKVSPSDVGVIAPDPAQINEVEKLLIAQKIPASKAKLVANNQAMIFCPEPGLLVSANQGADAGSQFVPCSTDFKYVDSIVQRGVKESPRLAKLNLHVVAIPLNAFIKYLRQAPADRVSRLKVVPSGSIAELVRQFSKQGKLATPASPPAKP